MIHALPGMGADHRMFPDPWVSLPDFIAHDWPKQIEEKSIPEVAQNICTDFGIQDGDVLVGASLGGMVACEIAKLRRLDSLYLIGSATNKEEVSRLLEILHPLAKVAPFNWLKYSAGKIPSDLAKMFSGVDASFVRNMCGAIFKWNGLGAVTVRLFRIHGRRDLVIPLPHQVDLEVDGGHLISITNAHECVEFIKNMQSRR